MVAGAANFRGAVPMSDFKANWRAGYGVIQHTSETVERMESMLEQLLARGALPDRETGFALLAAADRIASQGLWLVAHMTYAARVYTDGRELGADDFKQHPEGHTGGALNIAIAYVGYLLANALSGHTRAWLMEQGHCVAAIDSVNILVGNSGALHAARYPHSDAGLTALVNDFYSYAIDAEGRPASPIGSHVNAHTAGGILEGGYLGFAGLQYVHMPLPGQRLVAFLSDGAFEEQRGPDWAPRWWRAEDCGLVAPIMIANGRRIDQRTTMSQSGGTDWFKQHLRLNGFEPIVIDGRDPVAFAWAILTQERYIEHAAQRVADGKEQYPIALPYTIAETVKGFGFPGAGSNRAHNLPLPGNPHVDAQAREQFNSGAQRLFVAAAELEAAVATLNNHGASRRERERDHALADIRVAAPLVPELPWQARGACVPPMAGLDAAFVALVRANPQLRPRVGNPDELRSNRCNSTLDLLKHRVTAPEPGIAEAVQGAVITALNEEAVACAVLGNKQGLNLLVSYEAFAAKMLGSLRQEIIFSRHCKESGRAPGWRSVPLVVTSHTWENGKNEQSHQDPTIAEALLGEMSDVSRVLFPVDWNSAIASLLDVYAGCGAIATLVVPKNELPVRLDADQARALVTDGLLCIDGENNAPLQLLAIGAYQLEQALLAAQRLRERGAAVSVWAVLEPGRLRAPRDACERDYIEGSALLLPAAEQRVLFCHTRPEPMLGALRPLDLGPARTRALGYCNRGGTLDSFGMLFANRCTWAHGLAALAELRGVAAGEWLSAEELAAVEGRGDPQVLRK
jgi:phosphoketolase